MRNVGRGLSVTDTASSERKGKSSFLVMSLSIFNQPTLPVFGRRFDSSEDSLDERVCSFSKNFWSC